MSLPRSVAEVLREHVTLELESIDRMYFNVYVPQLQREPGVATFFRVHPATERSRLRGIDRAPTAEAGWGPAGRSRTPVTGG